MEGRNIHFLNLYFPLGATVAQCDEIAWRIQPIVGANVSEGGMTPTNRYGMYVDDVTFSEESMSYTFGYERKEKTP